MYYKKIGNHYIIRGSFTPGPSVTIPTSTAFAQDGIILGMGAICYATPYGRGGVCTYLNGKFYTNHANNITNDPNAYSYSIIV